MTAFSNVYLSPHTVQRVDIMPFHDELTASGPIISLTMALQQVNINASVTVCAFLLSNMVYS